MEFVKYFDKENTKIKSKIQVEDDGMERNNFTTLYNENGDVVLYEKPIKTSDGLTREYYVYNMLIHTIPWSSGDEKFFFYQTKTNGDLLDLTFRDPLGNGFRRLTFNNKKITSDTTTLYSVHKYIESANDYEYDSYNNLVKSTSYTKRLAQDINGEQILEARQADEKIFNVEGNVIFHDSKIYSKNGQPEYYRALKSNNKTLEIPYLQFNSKIELNTAYDQNVKNRVVKGFTVSNYVAKEKKYMDSYYYIQDDVAKLGRNPALFNEEDKERIINAYKDALKEVAKSYLEEFGEKPNYTKEALTKAGVKTLPNTKNFSSKDTYLYLYNLYKSKGGVKEITPNFAKKQEVKENNETITGLKIKGDLIEGKSVLKSEEVIPTIKNIAKFIVDNPTYNKMFKNKDNNPTIVVVGTNVHQVNLSNFDENYKDIKNENFEFELKRELIIERAARGIDLPEGMSADEFRNIELKSLEEDRNSQKMQSEQSVAEING